MAESFRNFHTVISKVGDNKETDFWKIFCEINSQLYCDFTEFFNTHSLYSVLSLETIGFLTNRAGRNFIPTQAIGHESYSYEF